MSTVDSPDDVDSAYIGRITSLVDTGVEGVGQFIGTVLWYWRYGEVMAQPIRTRPKDMSPREVYINLLEGIYNSIELDSILGKCKVTYVSASADLGNFHCVVGGYNYYFCRYGFDGNTINRVPLPDSSDNEDYIDDAPGMNHPTLPKQHSTHPKTPPSCIPQID